MQDIVVHTETRACMPYFVCARLGNDLLSVELHIVMHQISGYI